MNNVTGQTFTSDFDLRQSGTYWYHSHTMLQEPRGMYGSLVIAPQVKGRFDRLRDHVVVLSDCESSVLHSHKPVSEIRLTLDGDMERYVWFVNNKPLFETDHIGIKRDEIVRFIMIKHTVDVPPMTTTVIEFVAEELGDWFFHCHLSGLRSLRKARRHF